MPDEILARYENANHDELYQQLMAGDPEQVDTLAARWRSAHDTVSGLAATLSRDLTQLMPLWEGAAGSEYQRRVQSVVTFAETLAGELDDLRSGLTTMAEALREAQREAESPEETDDHDALLGGAGGGALAGSRFGIPGVVVGGVIGGITGYNQDEQEKEAARQRTIALVGQLAVEYRMTEQTNLTMELQAPPEELPVGSPDTRVAPIAGPPVTAPTRVDTLGTFDGGTTTLPPTPSQVGEGPGVGGQVDPEDGTGTGLLGVGDAPLAGAGGAPGTGGLSAGSGGGGAALGAGGSSTGLSGLSGTPASRALGAGDAIQNRAAAGTSRGTSGTVRADQRAATRGAGPAGEGETDEYLTWLTEDEMVWGDDPDAPPSVLGTAPPAAPSETSAPPATAG